MVEEAKALAEVMQQRATVTAVFESCDTERVGLLDSEQVAAALKLLRIHTSRVRLRLAVRKVKDPPPDRLFDILSPFPSHLNLQELVAVLRHVDPQGNWGSVDVTGDYAQLVGGIAMRSMAEGGGHKGVGAERLAAIEAKRRAKLEEDEAARAARHAKGDVSDSSEYVAHGCAATLEPLPRHVASQPQGALLTLTLSQVRRVHGLGLVP